MSYTLEVPLSYTNLQPNSNRISEEDFGLSLMSKPVLMMIVRHLLLRKSHND
jgi:hypothetical protein